MTLAENVVAMDSPTAYDPSLPYKVADLAQADFGDKEMQLAENEMPGLMAVREKYGPRQPLKGLNHRQPAHDHPDRGADRDPGRARRRGALGSCNIFSTQDHAAAAIAAASASPSTPGRARPWRILVVHRAGAELAGRQRART
jgi:hypothetical protein